MFPPISRCSATTSSRVAINRSQASASFPSSSSCSPGRLDSRPTSPASAPVASPYACRMSRRLTALRASDCSLDSQRALRCTSYAPVSRRLTAHPPALPLEESAASGGALSSSSSRQSRLTAGSVTAESSACGLKSPLMARRRLSTAKLRSLGRNTAPSVSKASTKTIPCIVPAVSCSASSSPTDSTCSLASSSLSAGSTFQDPCVKVEDDASSYQAWLTVLTDFRKVKDDELSSQQSLRSIGSPYAANRPQDPQHVRRPSSGSGGASARSTLSEPGALKAVHAQGHLQPARSVSYGQAQ